LRKTVLRNEVNIMREPIEKYAAEYLPGEYGQGEPALG